MATFLALLDALAPDPVVRGREFERVRKWYLEHAPEYRSQLRHVWL